MLDRVLVANRGEIAARILDTLHDLDVEAVAVHSAEDRRQPHVRRAHAAVDLGTGGPAGTYLDAATLVDAALETGCEAVHPGYGFLSEDAAFARAVEAAGLTWIGPPPSALELLGDKARALELAAELGVPTTPGSDGPVATLEDAEREIERIGTPAVVKAVHGGGGMGMRRVDAPDELAQAYAEARQQAKAAFGSGEVLIERWWDQPRHVEVQVALDAHGDGVHVFERECSIQRRHQKLVEEAPAPCVDDELRRALTSDALELCHAAGVENLATVEFLVVDSETGYVFNEVNPRLQVEHTVTEMVTGEDLVAWQLALASGDPLPRSQDELTLQGAAVEARVNAEDPLDGFQPAPGPVTHVHVPQGKGIRVDHALVPGGQVAPAYDSLVAKVIGHGPTREAALDRCRKGLAELRVGGRPTTAPFLHQLLGTEAVREARMHTGIVDETVLGAYRDRIRGAMACLVETVGAGDEGRVRLAGHEAGWQRTDGELRIDDLATDPIGERVDRSRVRVDGIVLEGRAAPKLARRAGAELVGGHVVESPIPGTVVDVLVEPGDAVDTGTDVVVVEAMKMNNRVGARGPGTVAEVLVEEDQPVDQGAPLVRVDAEDD